jgi:hypothetical protein
MELLEEGLWEEEFLPHPLLFFQRHHTNLCFFSSCISSSVATKGDRIHLSMLWSLDDNRLDQIIAFTSRKTKKSSASASPERHDKKKDLLHLNLKDVQENIEATTIKEHREITGRLKKRKPCFQRQQEITGRNTWKRTSRD